jgi:4,5-DOPA dioxygenase extradiol
MLPVLFISHGSPVLPLHPHPAIDFLKQLGSCLEKPSAILVISAHWGSRVPTVSAAPQPETIHDFWGFPSELYQLTYPAPGAPDLAERVAKLLAQAGFDYKISSDRGLDHGAWEPLMLMYPNANIPVTQLSIQPQKGTAYHWQLGKALAPLRQEGVLIIASGAITHNLRAFGQYSLEAEPVEWAAAFDDWIAQTIVQPNINVDDLLNYRQIAPYASQNHPTEEHLLPLFVALGAAEPNPIATQLHSSFTYGVLSMATYAIE